jgi:large subunit ribosomal protein L31
MENYKELKVVLTDGSSFMTRSCYDKGNVLKLDVDPLNHPAWRKENANFVNSNNSQVNRFEKKFGSSAFNYK